MSTGLTDREFEHLVDLIRRANPDELLGAVTRRCGTTTKPMATGETRVMFRLPSTAPKRPRRLAVTKAAATRDYLAEDGV